MAKLEINRVRKAYEKWRGSESKETPVQLREKVVALCQRYGDKRISQELRVSTGSLWQWRQQLSLMKKTRGKRPAKVATNVKPIKFLEITPTDAPVYHSSLTQLEWQRSDGSRMRMESGISLDEVSRLVSSFLSTTGGER